MPLRFRSFCAALSATLLVLSACVGTSPAPAVVAGAPSPAASVDMPIVAQAALPQGFVRCGVDDEAVPLGEWLLPSGGAAGNDRRFLGEIVEPPPSSRALPMAVSVEVRGDGLGSTDRALASLFAPCAGRATEADNGTLSVRVAFAESGAPRTSGPAQDAGAPRLSPYASCLVERACQLPALPGLAGKTAALETRTKVVAPVFRGKVETLVVFGQPPPGMGPPRVSKVQQAKLDAINAPVEAAILRCARSLPPADDIFFSFQIELAPRSPPVMTMVALEGHAETVRRCVEGALAGSLPALDRATLVTATVQIVARGSDQTAPSR